MSNIIEFKNVCFEYSDDNDNQVILTDFNLSINSGDFVAILGHNGSGKSTIARLMNGLKKPTNGKVFVDGLDTTNEEYEYEIRKNVGLVFQNPDNQLVATIVEDDVAFGPENLMLEPNVIRERVDYSLKAVGMYELKERAPHLLSGGQKQRVAIAGVLAMQPKCIVLDEPTAMLDPIGRKEVIDTLFKLNKEKGITIVLITHYMEEVIGADRIIVMDDGGVVLDDTPNNVFSQVEVLKKAGLGIPQTAELCYRLNELGIKLKGDVLTVEDCAGALARRLK